MRNRIKLFEEYLDDIDLIMRLKGKYGLEWINRVKENILNNSNNQGNIESALSEWSYTGNFHVRPKETCQICSQHPIIYMFEIYNDITKRILLIGSDCIQKFSVIDTKSIRIYDENKERILNDELIKRKIRKDLNSMIDSEEKKRAINILEKLTEITKDPYIENLYLEYTETDKMSPNRILYIYRLLKLYGIQFNPRDFNVDLLHYSSVDEMIKMDDNDYNIIWKFLNNDQRNKAMARKNYWLQKGGI